MDNARYIKILKEIRKEIPEDTEKNQERITALTAAINQLEYISKYLKKKFKELEDLYFGVGDEKEIDQEEL